MSPSAVSPLQLLTGTTGNKKQLGLVTSERSDCSGPCCFGPRCSGPGDLALVVGLNDVAVLEVLEVREPDTALEARRHFADVVLEAAQRVDGTLPDDRSLAQEAHLGPAGDLAVTHVATGHGADPGHPEDL